MKEPPRIREGGEGLLAATLLDAARSYRRPPSSRGRLMKALGVPVAVSVAVPAVATASSLATKVIVLVSAATVAAGGGLVAYQVHAGREAERAQRAIALAKPPQAARAVATSGEAAPAPPPAAPEVSATAKIRLPAPRHAAPARHPAAPPPPPAAAPRQPAAPASAPIESPTAPPVASPQRAPLAREIALLEAAERDARRNDHAAALVTLSAYARAFPDGALEAEAQVLRIASLLALGDGEAARREARSFLAHHAPSPLTTRVRSMLSAHSGQKELP